MTTCYNFCKSGGTGTGGGDVDVSPQSYRQFIDMTIVMLTNNVMIYIKHCSLYSRNFVHMAFLILIVSMDCNTDLVVITCTLECFMRC